MERSKTQSRSIDVSGPAFDCAADGVTVSGLPAAVDAAGRMDPHGSPHGRRGSANLLSPSHAGGRHTSSSDLVDVAGVAYQWDATPTHQTQCFGNSSCACSIGGRPRARIKSSLRNTVSRWAGCLCLARSPNSTAEYGDSVTGRCAVVVEAKYSKTRWPTERSGRVFYFSCVIVLNSPSFHA
jgi:hypothetical protein